MPEPISPRLPIAALPVIVRSPCPIEVEELFRKGLEALPPSSTAANFSQEAQVEGFLSCLVAAEIIHSRGETLAKCKAEIASLRVEGNITSIAFGPSIVNDRTVLKDFHTHFTDSMKEILRHLKTAHAVLAAYALAATEMGATITAYAKEHENGSGQVVLDIIYGEERAQVTATADMRFAARFGAQELEPAYQPVSFRQWIKYSLIQQVRNYLVAKPDDGALLAAYTIISHLDPDNFPELQLNTVMEEINRPPGAGAAEHGVKAGVAADAS